MTSIVKVLKDKVELRIPEEFAFMDDEQAKQVFIGTVPEVLYGIEEKKAFISITRTDTAIAEEDLEKRISEYYQAYSRSVANFANGGIAKRILQDGTPIAAFHYTSTTVERDMLNYLALFPLEGKEVVMSMHCSVEDSLVMGRKFISVLNSITIC